MVIIRKAEPKDAKEIKQVHVSAYQKNYRGFLPDDFLDNLKLDDEVIERTQNHIKTNEYLVAECEGKVVGFAKLCVPAEKEIEIQALYIHPNYQKRGIGTLLVNRVWQEKKEQGFRKLIIWTIKNGPSIGFYLKQGFKETNMPEKIWKFDRHIMQFAKEI